MKSYNDKRYQKYEHIIFDWWQKIPHNFCMGICDIRKRYYEEEDYYVFKIGNSCFIEPEYFERNPDITEDEIRFEKMCCWDNFISLDNLSDLNNLLKEAGAIKVYIHPSEYMYQGKPTGRLMDYIPRRREDELLIVIQDEEYKN